MLQQVARLVAEDAVANKSTVQSHRQYPLPGRAYAVAAFTAERPG